MRFLRLRTVPLALAALFATAACEGRAGAPDPASPGEVRIVSLAPSATEILFALGAGDRVVGVSRFCDAPAEALDRPKLGDAFQPNLEGLLALRPDWVLSLPGSGVPDLVRRAAPSIRVRTVRSETMEETFATIQSLGELVGRATAADALTGRIREGLRRIELELGGRPRVRALILVDRQPLWAVGPGSYLDDLLRIAGGENVVGAGRERWCRISLEEILVADPEVILEADRGDGRLDLGFWERFATLRAVREGRVYVLEGTSPFRPGPRMLEAAGKIARSLHPDLAGQGSALEPDATRETPRDAR